MSNWWIVFDIWSLSSVSIARLLFSDKSNIARKLQKLSNSKNVLQRRLWCWSKARILEKLLYPSDNFISCLYSGAWLGYVSPSNNKLWEWFTGYQGVLWADWQSGFSRTSDYTCGAWPNATWNIFRILLLIAAVFIFIVIIIRSTLAGALQKKKIQSVYIKILMNHLQLLNFDCII